MCALDMYIILLITNFFKVKRIKLYGPNLKGIFYVKPPDCVGKLS